MATFETLIEEAFTEVDPKTKKKVINVPDVEGKYEFKDTDKFTLSLDKRDFNHFKKLFTVKPQGDTGNGEVALFWLFGGMKQNSDTKHLGKRGEPDLLLFNDYVEVKAYDTKTIKVGKFDSQKDFTTMLTIIFSISNFVSKENELLTTSSFNFDKVKKAADTFCITREALLTARSSMTPKDQRIFDNLDIFSGIVKKAELFDDIATRVGLKNIVCNPKNKERAGGEKIAIEILKYGVSSVLKKKPGGGDQRRTGYFCVITSSTGTFAENTKITFYKIINSDGTLNLNNTQFDKLPQCVNITSSNMFINFQDLYS